MSWSSGLKGHAAWIGVSTISLGLATGASAADAASNDAFKRIKPIVDVRLRYEHVDQAPLPEDAEASTLRLRLGFETDKQWHTSLLAEGEFVWPLAGDYRDDNAVARNVAYPVIPDPESYELNRLQLTNTALPDTTVTLGRQRILLDDHRFVGNVGWRQNEQTFDAVRIVNRSLAPLTIDVTYLNRVNRIFGPDSPQGRYKGDGYLANLAYQTPIGKLTGFAYLLDFDAIDPPRVPLAMNPLRASSDTYGVRLAGEQVVSEIKLAYVASYATQEDSGRNPLTFDLDYSLLELTASLRGFSLTLGQEVLEGDGSVGFATPLATLHKFNGWADKFLTTPANGLEDRYGSLGYATKGWSVFDNVAVNVAYHQYETERGGFDLGDEFNVQLQTKWQRFTGTLKYADYDAKPVAATAAYQDTAKLWAMVEYAW